MTDLMNLICLLLVTGTIMYMMAGLSKVVGG